MCVICVICGFNVCSMVYLAVLLIILCHITTCNNQTLFVFCIREWVHGVLAFPQVMIITCYRSTQLHWLKCCLPITSDTYWFCTIYHQPPNLVTFLLWIFIQDTSQQVEMTPRAWFNIKTSQLGIGDSCHQNKTVVRASFLYGDNAYIWKTESWYWNGIPRTCFNDIN